MDMQDTGSGSMNHEGWKSYNLGEEVKEEEV